VSLPALTPTSATQKVDRVLLEFVQALKSGDEIRITQRVRVGSRQWTTTVTGKFRDLNFLATGLATQRIPEDDIVIPMVHFTKPNGELSSVALDEYSKVERVA
jgi:hypothetical protein